MALENLVSDLERKLKAVEAKKKVAVEKGSLELLFAFDEAFQETLFTLELLKSAMKDEGKARGAPSRTVQEIGEAEKKLFEEVNLEWLKRQKGKKDIDDLDFGLLQGKLTALEWVLGREGVEIGVGDLLQIP